jgi:glucoamylase
MFDKNSMAPGFPGIKPSWASSDKQGVGTSLAAASPVWFSLNEGILTEVYYPHVDEACVRDMGFIVTYGDEFFSSERTDTIHAVSRISDGVPAYKLINTCREGRYRIEKEVLCDSARAVVMQKNRFIPLKGDPSKFRLFVMLSPHIKNRGMDNTAWVDDYKGVPMLFAQREDISLALSSTSPFKSRSAGFSGASDGYQDLKEFKKLVNLYGRAESGNVALSGELEVPSDGGEFTLALGFGQSAAEAANCARASLIEGFDAAKTIYLGGWEEWQNGLFKLRKEPSGLFNISAAVLRVHEEKHITGGIIAGLSTPWGFSKGDDDIGGYHLVWTRDLVETAGGLLAAGAGADAIRVIHYLQTTQEADGHWPQNMWLDGTRYWAGIQMDETAFPILLVDMAVRAGALNKDEELRCWHMLRRAAAFIVCNGPVTQQDRWEEDPGYSPFTLAVEISALYAAADMAEKHSDEKLADYLRKTADIWNSQIERWTYAAGTRISKKAGVEGYYVRISPPDLADASDLSRGFVPIKNRTPGSSLEPARLIVSPDALALVRFGLRAADDPRIINTVKVVDMLLKSELTGGESWYRYNDDGYGEHDDGSPFDGIGKGRPWPLLTGERAHYELAAGRPANAEKLLKAFENFAGDGGMIPEQVWDSPAIPDKNLFPGRASGSAMPLAWAHAEYIKLRRSLIDGRVFDMPPRPEKKTAPDINYTIWRFNHKSRVMPEGNILRVETLEPALIHWSLDGWKTSFDIKTADSGLGIHFVDLPAEKITGHDGLTFTFYWTGAEKWEGMDYSVVVEK